MNAKVFIVIVSLVSIKETQNADVFSSLFKDLGNYSKLKSFVEF